ncbi:chemotaxis protein [Alkalihalobacillus pseudalcaliphilus]|uniref:chemotaxis protein n=1 Tax=Alkalihalobacillus pseudalcaliphilus TaxID=79884 RepID=UPI00064D84B3|nr:chemotaxis protein [Alkalihalobacillus pseudalcaliphilus]KMK76562.1 chemotaxis protein CheV [Alkalihalobacillus pseudalcaliphilus]
MKQDILLESGTNELEIVLFEIGGSSFGINVLKVREIIQPLPITATPNSHHHVEGIIRLREEVIPVVDLAKVLDLAPSDKGASDKFIIAELNQMKVAFHVHSVSRIHRISWNQIEKPSDLSTGFEAHTNGIVKMNDKLALLLDFEKIIVDINPKTGLDINAVKALGERERSDKYVLIAEDSTTLRQLLKDTLNEAGYEKLRFFENGYLLWDYLDNERQEQNDPDLIITDIEMPQMDGHHLTKKLKEDPRWNQIPVIVFSSIISEDLFHKGEKVGADEQISKPQIAKLIERIDQLVS